MLAKNCWRATWLSHEPAHTPKSPRCLVCRWSLEVGRPTVSIHLDTALAVLDDHDRLLPAGVQYGSAGTVSAAFPRRDCGRQCRRVRVRTRAVSDGTNVVLPVAAMGFAARFTRSGFEPVRCRSVRAAQGRRFRQDATAECTHDKSRGLPLRPGTGRKACSAQLFTALPAVAANAEIAWIADIDTALPAAYSAVNLGPSQPREHRHGSCPSRHRHPAESGLACRPTRALGQLAQLCGKDVVLPMNSGAEAVEAAHEKQAQDSLCA